MKLTRLRLTPALLITTAWLGLVGALLARLLKQAPAYGRHLSVATPAGPLPSLSVIIPARNEATNIERCLRSLMTQTYPSEELEFLVIDDDSTDDTAAIVRRLALADTRIRLLQAGPLPGGWTGKSHACWQGARQAESEWLCFLDADMEGAPPLLAATLSYAQQHGVELLTLTPQQELATFWERLIVPEHALILAMLAVDLGRVNDPAMQDAMANGQFMLMRRSVYQQLGGHAAIQAAVLEDWAMARLFKHNGYRLQVIRGDNLLRTRMYTNLEQLWEGFAKNTVDIMGSTPKAIGAAGVALLLGWLPVVLPWWAWALNRRRPDGLQQRTTLVGTLVGSGVVISLHGVALRLLHVPWWHLLLFPLGLTVEAAIILDSIRRKRTDRTTWKGRVYPALKASADPFNAPKPSSSHTVA